MSFGNVSFFSFLFLFFIPVDRYFFISIDTQIISTPLGVKQKWGVKSFWMIMTRRKKNVDR